MIERRSHVGGPLRRALLGGALAALSVGALAAPAGALQLDNTTDTNILVDSNIHWFNDVRPITSGNYQVMVYWDSEAFLGDSAPLKVTRRNLTNDALEHTSFDGTWELTDVVDGHNTVRSGISPIDGRIHIAWTTHNDALNYVYSNAGCLSTATFSRCTWTHTNTQADRAHEFDFVTYPTFVNDRDGNLFMMYRFGSSEKGDQYLNKYNNNGTWTAVGRILHGYDQDGAGGAYTGGGTYDPDGAGPIQPSTERGPYVWDVQFDKNDRLHMMWNWRENSPQYGGSNAQHGAYYAYSDDDGATWKNSAGTTVGTVGANAIDVNDSTLVADFTAGVGELPYNTHFSALEMELDSNNQPHAVFPASDVVTVDFRDTNQRQKHIWRTSSGRWYEQWIEPAGGKWQAWGIGDLFFDGGDNAYYIYGRNNLGWEPWNADPFAQAELRWDLFTWQPNAVLGGHLNVQQMTTATNIQTNNHANTAIDTTTNKQVRIRMRNNTDGDDLSFWWTTDASPAFDAGKSQTFSNVLSVNDGFTDTDWVDYTFTITDADWRGTLRDLLIEVPVGTTADAGDEYDIDWIRITNSAGTVVRSWEFDEPARVVAAEAGATGNWPSWNIGTLLNDVNDVWSDGGFQVDTQRYADGSGDTRKVNFTVLEQGSPWYERLSLRQFDISGDTTLKSWNYDVDAQGWTAANHVSGFGYVSDGGANSITGTVTGNDSQVISADNLKVRLEAAARVLHVRMKNGSTATQAAVCFTTDADQTFNAGKCKTFAITANSGYTEYTVDMSTFAQWTSANTLRRLRIDPVDNASSGTFHISRVYIAPS